MWSKKVAAFSKIIQNAGYCVRMPPSLAQIKKYLKKVKNASKTQLDSITEVNVAEKFALFWKNDFTEYKETLWFSWNIIVNLNLKIR